MKPHPRIRRTIKWGGAAMTVLLVVAWVGSATRGLTAYYGRVTVNIEHGQIVVNGPTPGGAPWPNGLTVESTGPYFFQLKWWGTWWSRPPRWTASVPVWPFALVAGLTVLAAWSRELMDGHRARLNLCPKCGYDRTGIARDAKCPECGAAPASV